MAIENLALSVVLGSTISLGVVASKAIVFALSIFEYDGTTPQDLTSLTLQFHATVAGIAINKSSATSGGIVINTPATSGTATLTLLAADTAGIEGMGFGRCELTAVDGSGNPFEIASGTFTVTQNVGTP